jgi:dihydroorotase
MLDYSAFEKETGLPIIFGQQNPPLRSFRERREFLQEVGDDAVYASDHAPHTIQEKLKGISGMPQASTEGQVYLEHMSLGHCSLAGFIRRRSLNPGKLLEQQFGLTMGRITQGYDASFTLVSLGKPSRICDKDVLSKCSWTPYCNWVLSNTIEGVIIRGVLYTQKALQLLRQ